MGPKVDAAIKIQHSVYNALISVPLPQRIALHYSLFAYRLYNYIESHPELQTALKFAETAHDGIEGVRKLRIYLLVARLERGARVMENAKFVTIFEKKSTVSGGGAIVGLVSFLVGIAQSLGIEMNACAIAITKEILKILAMFAEVDTVVGAWAAALQILSLYENTTDMINACISP